jgi:diacylglycerol kinase (ATP)
MKLLLFINPLAAHGRAGKSIKPVCETLASLGIEAEVFETAFPGHATEALQEMGLDSFDAVAAAGGDGTLFETLNGLMAHPPERRVPLGLIPLGTGNAFSRDIGLAPGQWREGIELIARGSTRQVDVGLLEYESGQFHFLNIAGIGFVADAGQTSARLKFTGRMAYTLGAIRECLRLKSHELEIEVDGISLSQISLFLEVSNSRYTGSAFLVAPNALIDDGLLDVVCVRKLSRTRLLQLFPTIYSGRHVKHEEVSVFQGREVRILAPAGLRFMVDGELRGCTPARIECLPAAVEMFAA